MFGRVFVFIVEGEGDSHDQSRFDSVLVHGGGDSHEQSGFDRVLVFTVNTRGHEQINEHT